VRSELIAGIMENQKRLFVSVQRLTQRHQIHLQGLGRGLGDPKRLLEHSMQKLDSLSGRLDLGLQSWLDRRTAQVNHLAAKISLPALRQKIGDAERHIKNFAERLVNTEGKILRDRQQKLANLSSLLESLSFKGVLARGYTVVRDAKGNIVSSVKQAMAEKDVLIVFSDGEAEASVKKQA
jgi:exodeoxyribonuclease VII large subunit